MHNGISTFACSETQKFGHVTFFWNGNRSGYFDSKMETYLEVRGWTGGGGDTRAGGRTRHCSRPTPRPPACGGRALHGVLAVTHNPVHRSSLHGAPTGPHLRPGSRPFSSLQIPSDKVPFNELPDMKAFEITEAGKEALRSGKYQMVRSSLRHHPWKARLPASCHVGRRTGRRVPFLPAPARRAGLVT